MRLRWVNQDGVLRYFSKLVRRASNTKHSTFSSVFCRWLLSDEKVRQGNVYRQKISGSFFHEYLAKPRISSQIFGGAKHALSKIHYDLKF